MPFDYEAYQKKCNELSTEELHREWENYTRQLAGGATSTTTSVLFAPLTAGISLLGLGLSAPRVHNARKKREIIEAGLQARGTTHNTRKRDVVAPMAIAGTISGLTLGLAGPGADLIAGEAVGHGVEYAASHVALDATGAVLEHKHDAHKKKKVSEKMKLQYQNFQEQYIGEQVAPQMTPSNVGEGVPGQLAPIQATVVSPIHPEQQNYGYVSPPPAYNSGPPYQPVYYQQPALQPLQPQNTTLPLYQPPQSSGILAIHEKSTNYSTINSTSELSSQVSPASQAHTMSKEDQKPPRDDLYDNDDEPTPMPPSVEEEILYLKARLLQLEIEKREALLKKTAPEDSQNQPEKPLEIPSHPELKIVPPMSVSVPQPQLYIPPGTTPQPSNIAPSGPPVQPYYPPPPSPKPQIQTFPPPPPSTRPQMQNYPPPPPSPKPPVQNLPPPPPLPASQPLYRYQPQNYAPQLPPRAQQTYQPHNFSTPPITNISIQQTPQVTPSKSPTPQQPPFHQRQDSGYFSGPPTLSSPSPYNLQQSTISPVSPQTANSPAPPPYFPPPPGATPQLGFGGKDYFNQGQQSQQLASNVIVSPMPGYQGQNGWTWGSAASGVAGGEPNYGPPPPIPSPWRSS
ncbi:hypothetical protein F5884DRAFT_799761 [Xylogone sp. PMI_703]|nr:hypothetical protein F5884DRAFT_799761 [Xylogone sp. PMI_703]